MATRPLTKERREDLLARHRASSEEYVRAVESDSLDYDEERKLYLATEALAGEYFASLPSSVLGVCPFCGAHFRHSFDPWGFDGFWWQEGAAKSRQEPPTCSHFGVLQGAVSLNGPHVQGGEDEAFLGPGVPFVIPRVLEQPSVVAVVMAFPMDAGHTAYPITYYSRDPLPPHSFTQPWTRKSFSWPDGKGGFGWRIDTDPWDFELEPWVGRGKVFWIEPGDDEYRLRSAGDGTCPFVDMQGVRERQYVKGDQLWTLKPPQGEGVDPFSK